MRQTYFSFFIQDWNTCKKFANPHGPAGLNRRLQTFDIDHLHPEIGARCKELLQGLEFKQMQAVSAGAATFYVWVNSSVTSHPS